MNQTLFPVAVGASKKVFRKFSNPVDWMELYPTVYSENGDVLYGTEVYVENEDMEKDTLTIWFRVGPLRCATEISKTGTLRSLDGYVCRDTGTLVRRLTATLADFMKLTC